MRLNNIIHQMRTILSDSPKKNLQTSERGNRLSRISKRHPFVRWEMKPQPSEPTLTFNTDFQSWELRFPNRPTPEFKTQLIGAGFRYIFKGQHVWYSRNGEVAKHNGERLISLYYEIQSQVSTINNGEGI